ncbi:hypothetical protein TWF281_006953 [Arthrobotrys megalospora]
MCDSVRLSWKQYTIGWLCVSQHSAAAARAMLDVRHEPCELPFDDDSAYTYGSISGHNVVIACAPYGTLRTNSTSALIQTLSRSFPNMEIYLLVGTGSGVPRNPAPRNAEDDIHLGDVVVGWNKRAGVPSIVQCDVRGEDIRQNELGINILDKPDPRILNALTTLVINHHDGETKFAEHLKRSKVFHPGLESDTLYEPTYTHTGTGNTCSACDPGQLVARPKRNVADLVFHQGTMLSGNSLIKSADARDRLAKRFHNAMCIETEAAGVIDNERCLVIRGISDYADSHKNESWQSYAAAAAAAFAREYLYTVRPLPTEAKKTRKRYEYNIPSYLPYPRNLNFTGREEVFTKIRKLFWSSNSTNEPLVYSPGRRVVALSGIGGSGKTHTALEYAYRYKNEYSAIFWLNATNKAELEKAARKAIESIISTNTRNTENDTKDDCNKTYLRVAHSLGIHTKGIVSDETLMKAVAGLSPINCLGNWLRRESNDRWLIILDGYDESKILVEEIDKLLHLNDAGNVLITSRLPNSYQECSEIRIPDRMEEPDAMELLSKVSGISVTQEDRRSAVDLVRSLGCLPLAIDLAGAYLHKHPMSFTSYTEPICENTEEPIGRFNTVLKVSFRKLTKGAKHLIQLFSLIRNEDIPYRLFEASREIVDWMRPRMALDRAIGELLSVSFINQRQDNSYYLHPLVHQWVRNHTDNAIISNSLFIVDIVTSTFVFGDERSKSQSAYEYRILPHIECCSEILFKHLASENGPLDDKSKRVAYNLARVYTNLGDIAKSSAVYERSLKDLSGLPSCLDLKMMDAFGVNLKLQGKYNEALRWCTHALDGINSRGGEDSQESLIITSHIAGILKEKGDYAGAITKYRRVLEQGDRKKTGYAKTLMLETQYQLAGVLTESEEYLEALYLLNQVKDEREMRLGKHHPSVLQIIEDITTVLEKQRSDDQVLEHRKVAFEGQRKSLGESHYLTITNQGSVARAYEKLGRYEECLTHFNELLKQLEDIFGAGEEHPWIVNTYSGIADAAMYLRRYSEAEESYRQAYAGFKKIPATDGAELLIASKIAGILRDQGKYKEALQWSQEAERGLGEELGGESDLLLVAKTCTAGIYALQEDYERALDLYEQVLEGYQGRKGANNAEILKTELSIVEASMKQGRYQTALEFLDRTEKGLVGVVDVDHDQTVKAAKLRNEARDKLDEEARRKLEEEAIRRKQKEEEEEESRRKHEGKESRRKKRVWRRWSCFKGP